MIRSERPTDNGWLVFLASERVTRLLQGWFLILLASGLPSFLSVVAHLMLVGLLVVVTMFWICLASWIVVRLARTVRKRDPLR